MGEREQIERFWADFDERLARDGARGYFDDLSAGLPPAESAFERAGVRDATGETGEAVDLYREALAGRSRLRSTDAGRHPTGKFAARAWPG